VATVPKPSDAAARPMPEPAPATMTLPPSKPALLTVELRCRALGARSRSARGPRYT